MSSLTWRRTSSSGMPSGCLAIFFLIFLLAGAAVLWFLFVRPALKVVKAQAWSAVDCTVVESQVEESSSDDGTTYRANVVTAYSFNGGEYRAGSYDFSGKVYSSGYDGKAKVVSQYPVGTRTTCYVNPEDPNEAVISRAFSATYLFGLFGLLFFLPGLFGLIWVLSGGVKTRTGLVKVDPAMPFGVTNPQGQDASGPVELKPQATPTGKFIGLLITSLFWNGIVGTISWFVILKPEQKPEGCAIAFLAVFALIGLLLIYATIRQFLVLFNPRPRLTLSPASLGLGQTAYLQWRLTGPTGGLRRLKVTLEGKEEARYRRGTDTHTDCETFATLTLVDSTDSYEMASGSTSFAMPANTMPSFTAANNRVVWTMKAQLEIAGWPDSDEEFEILVQP
jgi:hypothetical protein